METILALLRTLNEPVPKPPRLPTLDEITQAEQKYDFTFHDDYKQFLLEASDVVLGTLEPTTIPSDTGHTFIGEVVTNARQLGLPLTFVPIAEDNGDYYCMKPSGDIIFWSHHGVNDECWPDLETWIREVWIGEHASE